MKTLVLRLGSSCYVFAMKNCFVIVIFNDNKSFSPGNIIWQNIVI
jgi:hypothetical protein